MNYGISRVSAYKLIEDTLNFKEIKVFDQIVDPEALNKKEKQKQERLKRKFKSWIFNNQERRNRLVK